MPIAPEKKEAMKRILLTSVITFGLITTFDFATLTADDVIPATKEGATEAIPAPPLESEAISRGFRGGGGGFRRGGGGGGYRSGGYRSGGYRSGGYRSGGSGAHTQPHYANNGSNNGRSSGANNARSNNRGGNANHSNGGKSSGKNGGKGGSGNGDGGGAWDADAIVLVDVIPYTPDFAPVVITLLNPVETRLPVNYSLGGGLYTLEAGQWVGHGDATQIISFDRGGSFGQAQYTLAPGTYRFVSTDHGWDLYTVSDQAAATDPGAGNANASRDSHPLTWLRGG
jgi:hypothetical protein